MLLGCPKCSGELARIRRRRRDRVFGTIRQIGRFRCTMPGCHWEGNLSLEPPDRPLWQVALLVVGLALGGLVLGEFVVNLVDLIVAMTTTTTDE